jgi:hypothetical protein
MRRASACKRVTLNAACSDAASRAAVALGAVDQRARRSVARRQRHAAHQRGVLADALQRQLHQRQQVGIVDRAGLARLVHELS